MRRNRANRYTPRVIVGCVADCYSTVHERSVEFTFPDGTGGLIFLHAHPSADGTTYRNSVTVHRIDPGIAVQVPARAGDRAGKDDPHQTDDEAWTVDAVLSEATECLPTCASRVPFGECTCGRMDREDAERDGS